MMCQLVSFRMNALVNGTGREGWSQQSSLSFKERHNKACSEKSCFWQAKKYVFNTNNTLFNQTLLQTFQDPKEQYQLVENGHYMTPLKWNRTTILCGTLKKINKKKLTLIEHIIKEFIHSDKCFITG